MLSKEEKKEAISKFKERKTPLGIYAVRCASTGEVWVGASRNLDASRNSVMFSLRLGLHREPSLQREWNAHGESAFSYEILEKLDEDVIPMAIKDLLAEKKKHWLSRLNAHGLL